MTPHDLAGAPPALHRRNLAAYRHLAALLASADVRLDGQRPWDLHLLGEGVPERILAHGNLGLGETYMDGLWTCQHLDQLFDRLLRADMASRVRSLSTAWHHLRARWLNLQTEPRAWQVGQQHYDLGNAFYAAMLDRRMTYTCALWEGARDLDEAQENKLELVCQKLGLQPGMHVLDIGCGWGSFMKYAAERHGVRCTGVTISAEQAALGRTLCEGLPIEFRLMDYRGLSERIDRVVSLGMFEHVGQKNYDAYMAVAQRCLAPDGLFLLHTIGRN